MKLDPSLTPLAKINLKCIKDLRPKTVKLLEVKIREQLPDIGLGNDFFFI